MTITHAKKEAAANAHLGWLRAPDAAAYVGLSESTLAKMRCRGDGPRYSKAGKIVLYATAVLDDWLEARSRLSTSEAA